MSVCLKYLNGQFREKYLVFGEQKVYKISEGTVHRREEVNANKQNFLYLIEN